MALKGPGALGVQVRLHFEPNARHVLVDRIQIQQVLVNLMRNAIEAMDASRRRELDVATSLLDERMVEIAVADSGPGLADDIAAPAVRTIRFHQAERHGTRPLYLPLDSRGARRPTAVRSQSGWRH